MTMRAGKKKRLADRTDISPLKDLRELMVLVIHPDNEDGQNLTAQLQRIGCQIRTQWPIPERPPLEADLVILAVTPQTLAVNAPWLLRGNPPVLPVISFENPLLVEALLTLNACAMLPAPIKSFGVMTAMVLTLNQAKRSREREKHVKRLESRLMVSRIVQKATHILTETRQLSERDAYNALRAQAMAKREPLEKIAEAIVRAHEFYQLPTPKDDNPSD
ncbi:MAG TPA: ANTAR domain-containing protein [Pseudomonas sp.]|uniref:ANTAR domain-containing response regulator n=1 Tax=Pseudomonas sp. TaxID=306 RepID=UPI002ED8CAFD